jgi:hypothetical protein
MTETLPAPSRLDLTSLAAELADLEGDASLWDEEGLAARARALDLVALIAEVARLRGRDEGVGPLQRRSAGLRRRLIAANRRLFERVRTGIREGRYTRAALRKEFDRFTSYTADEEHPIHLGFDALDSLVDGILGVRALPTARADSELPDPDMVHYEPTPARVVMDLVDHAGLRPRDVFYDLGSGRGHVAILVHLLTGVQAIGVERQPALCAAARRSAARLGLADVAFVEADARDVDYADGTFFYLFTPFKGRLLNAVLTTLRREARARPITIASFGPCTRRIFAQPWLQCDDPTADHAFRLAMFRSV